LRVVDEHQHITLCVENSLLKVIADYLDRVVSFHWLR
jgi:hypothetical protein